MARVCEICGKGVQKGNLVSHSNIKSKRTFSPNLQTAHVTVNGVSKKIRACTGCLSKAKAQK